MIFRKIFCQWSGLDVEILTKHELIFLPQKLFQKRHKTLEISILSVVQMV